MVKSLKEQRESIKYLIEALAKSQTGKKICLVKKQRFWSDLI
jgi:hypothetical protein